MRRKKAIMKELRRAWSARTTRATWAVSLVVLSAVAGCGGVIKFQDDSAIAIANAKPPPPPPPEEEKRVAMKEDRVEIKEKIKFAYNDDKILAESHSLLDEIADVIKKNPQVKKIEIGGHASSEGDDSKNMDLSKRRANSVMQYLTGKGGVGADHLVAKGFGETKLLVTPDDTEDKRETNRRVEFLVLEHEAAPEAKK
jgi:OOP family OmpA-OmpF porin